MPELLRGAVAILLAAAGLYTIFYAVYHLAFAIAGIPPARRRVWPAPRSRFALVVPAHDEEASVTGVIRSLATLDYPRDRFEVVVVADNCRDRTAEVAREAGATALERDDPSRPGKGAALEWAFGQLLVAEPSFDAFCVFDADNHVEPSFLRAVEARLQSGAQVVQGYTDTRNPDESWLTAVQAIVYWSANRLFQLGRARLGLSAILGGTGFGVSAALLREHGWRARSLTEDLEYQAQLALLGIRVEFAFDARIYDEKPAGLAGSSRQRLRWMQGYWDVAARYFPRLLMEGLRRRSPRRLEAAAYLVSPPRSLVPLAALVLFAAAFLAPSWAAPLDLAPGAWLAVWGASSLVPLLALPLEGAPARAYLAVFFVPVFAATWAPLTILGFLRRRARAWARTVHAPDSGAD